jgi:hypothetical protein
MDTLKLTTHPVIYGVKAEFPITKSINCGIIMFPYVSVTPHINNHYVGRPLDIKFK